MNRKTLAQRFCERDPLCVLLSDKLHLGPIPIAVGIAVVSFIVLWMELSLAGESFSNILSVVSAQALVIFPLAVILYFAVPEFVARPFTVLEGSDSIGASIDVGVEEYGSFREKMIASMGSFVWIGLGIILIVYYWYYRLFTDVPSDPSRLLAEPTRTLIRVALLIIYTPLLYMATTTAGRILQGLLSIGQFFRSFKIHVNPMNPDGAGGIGFVGQMLITSALMATALGAGAAALVIIRLTEGQNPLERVEIIILGLIYVIITPMLFSSLMWSPHRALIRAREDALRPLADEFERVSTQEIPSTERGIDTIKSRTDQLVEIKRQYELIQQTFPVWPLDVSALRSLLATSLLPAISTVFSGLISGLWTDIIRILGIKSP